jgi:tetratricopeptide (TPR) repeat protein
MKQHNELLLIDELDRMLSGEALTDLQDTLRSDKGAAAEWEYLKLAVEAVEYAAIYDRVDAIRKNFDRSAAVETKPQGAVVRSIVRTGLRIAAVLIVFLGVATIYKYSTVSSKSMYNEYYSPYTLGTVRGHTDKNALEEAYKNKDWKAVIDQFNLEAVRNSKSYFLAGMAEMELHHYPEAVRHFESVLAENEKNHDNFFQDETEYYLAMAYLMNKESDKGVTLLNQIRQNKNHLYYPLAKQISGVDLKIIDIKEKK